MKRPNIRSARAALNLHAMLEYRYEKEESMANKKTAKKKRLQERKKQEEALRNVQLRNK